MTRTQRAFKFVGVCHSICEKLLHDILLPTWLGALSKTGTVSLHANLVAEFLVSYADESI
jgi:hypothetical protein